MPLSYEFTPRARQSLGDAHEFLAQYGPETQARFSRAFAEAVQVACDETQPRQVLDETGSLAFSMPVYLRLFTTARTRKRGSNAGVWRLYYTVRDADGDGQADTVLVLLVSHAAAKPLTSWLQEGDEPESEPAGE